ncbi:MAG TPA: M18 family aminopeptidase [Clostridia bacterium]|nr:M18 family aminopeptidase [Clostridia bacterium]
MSKELDFAKELIDFIYDSPSSFHVVLNIRKMLEDNGFEELKEEDSWRLQKGGKYYMIKNHSTLAAFVAGTGDITAEGFRIIGAHNDSPAFRVKPAAEMTVENHYIKLDTESYGWPILSTWMDRPLSVAGRVAIKGSDVFDPVTRFVNIKKPILIIPNLAIHMNRKINSGEELNMQKDMLPLMALVNEKLEKDNYLLNVIAKEIDVPPSDIIDFDLFLYEFEKGTIMGLNDEFISSGRLDDLAMVHAGATALARSSASKSTNIMVCFDNEEVGSSTKQGADSPLLSSMLERIVLSMGGGREDYFRAISKSFMISADQAHAVHPNTGEKHDPQNRPVINKGPVIKISSNMKYTSDSVSSAVYAGLCSKAGVPVQWFVNRSDELGGSTIGPISASHLHMRSVDIGTPILAMHSVRELGGVLDHTYVTRSFEEFYNL